MADIKNYLKEKEKRQKNQSDYQEKIRKHRLSTVYRVLLVLAALAAVGVLIMVQYKRHIYTSYDIVSTVTREVADGAMDIRLGKGILTYSKDGAHSTAINGDVSWNQTYEIQDLQVAVCGNVAAIGSYNGRDSYVQSLDKQLGTITTTMPIRDLAVSSEGDVTAVLADTDVTWINTYNTDGEIIYTGQTRMYNSGYPMSVSLSPNGELLAVSYVYIDAGMLKTNVAFYNFGPVGANQSDFIVSAYSYQDLLVPEIQFMNNSVAFAVGDSRLMIYSGGQKPVIAAEYLYDREIRSVYYNEEYVGLVFLSESAESQYRMDVYNTEAKKVGSYYFDLDYTDIFFEQNQFVAYNETESTIITFEGV